MWHQVDAVCLVKPPILAGVRLASPPDPSRPPPGRKGASKIRTGHGPDNMATLRNLAINTLNYAGHSNIAAGLRHASYRPFTRPLDLLGIA